jgi:hypothetical protein
VSVASLRSLSGKEPASYEPHLLHSTGRTYTETNCYADVLIELLHGCGYEPLAMFGHLVRMDFEGDQWTFFKPPPDHLERLFGIDIHEMQPYRPLPEQIAEQIASGRSIIVELDSWYLPDTASTSYRSEHVKTSVAADAIDPDVQLLRYFHNTGLHELEGEDYRGVFRIGAGPGADAEAVLPPYTEIVRFDAGEPLGGVELKATARQILSEQLARVPSSNPFERFAEQLARRLPELLEGGLEEYHAYAFATVRMAGAAFEIAASHAEWVLGEEAAESAAAFSELVDGCKALSFRLARRRQFDPEPVLGGMAEAWTGALNGLRRRVA